MLKNKRLECPRPSDKETDALPIALSELSWLKKRDSDQHTYSADLRKNNHRHRGILLIKVSLR